MSTVTQIRAALADAVDGVGGLRASSYPPGSINPPSAVVTRQLSAFDQAFGNVDGWQFKVTVLVAYIDARTAQDQLDAFLSGSGTSSVRLALETDPTLGGVVAFTRAVSAGPDVLTEVNGVQYLSADITVEVG
jgi:hypothetical protein